MCETERERVGGGTEIHTEERKTEGGGGRENECVRQNEREGEERITRQEGEERDRGDRQRQREKKVTEREGGERETDRQSQRDRDR